MFFDSILGVVITAFRGDKVYSEKESRQTEGPTHPHSR